MDKVIIFGKDTCPYTRAARRDYATRNVPFEYRNVAHDPAALQQMLQYSGGQQRVPVIVENGRATVGYQGDT